MSDTQAARIIATLQAKGWSLHFIAWKMYAPYSTVVSWARGRHHPREDAAYRLRHLYQEVTGTRTPSSLADWPAALPHQGAEEKP